MVYFIIFPYLSVCFIVTMKPLILQNIIGNQLTEIKIIYRTSLKFKIFLKYLQNLFMIGSEHIHVYYILLSNRPLGYIMTE